jgi:hypothetical protein
MACTLCGSTETIIILERKIIDGIGNLTYKWVGLKNIVYIQIKSAVSIPRLKCGLTELTIALGKKFRNIQPEAIGAQ